MGGCAGQSVVNVVVDDGEYRKEDQPRSAGHEVDRLLCNPIHQTELGKIRCEIEHNAHPDENIPSTPLFKNVFPRKDTG